MSRPCRRRHQVESPGGSQVDSGRRRRTRGGCRAAGWAAGPSRGHHALRRAAGSRRAARRCVFGESGDRRQKGAGRGSHPLPHDEPATGVGAGRPAGACGSRRQHMAAASEPGAAGRQRAVQLLQPARGVGRQRVDGKGCRGCERPCAVGGRRPGGLFLGLEADENERAFACSRSAEGATPAAGGSGATCAARKSASSAE